jgi:hypothetical protein
VTFLGGRLAMVLGVGGFCVKAVAGFSRASKILLGGMVCTLFK